MSNLAPVIKYVYLSVPQTLSLNKYLTYKKAVQEHPDSASHEMFLHFLLSKKQDNEKFFDQIFLSLYWIGLKWQNTADSRWIWEDRTALNYDDWAQNEPKSDTSFYGRVQMNRNTGLWYTRSYYDTAHFICQRWPSGKNFNISFGNIF